MPAIDDDGSRSVGRFVLGPRKRMSRETRRSPSQQSDASADDQGELRLGGDVADSGLPDLRGRWTPLKKFRVLEAVRSGALAERDLWDKHRISKSEFDSWQRTFAEFGYAGLKTTQLQNLRRRRSSRN